MCDVRCAIPPRRRHQGIRMLHFHQNDNVDDNSIYHNKQYNNNNQVNNKDNNNIYDKEKNIVVEYDEPRHYDRYGNLRKKDVDRMNEIQHHLQCEFWRYNEKTKTLKRYK